MSVLLKQIREIRDRTGCGILECKEALDLFDGNINRCYEFLRMRSQAVCRRKPNGEVWRKEDYINYIKNNF